VPPRTRRTRETQPPLTLGIAGSGQLDVKLIAPILDDLTEGREVADLYLPVTDSDYTDEVAAVVAWAKDNDIAYTTLSDEDATKDGELKRIIEASEDDYDAGDSAGKAVVEMLAGDEKNPVADGRLLMFMDAEQDEDVAVFEEAAEQEVPAFDLCNGLLPISFDEDDAGDGEGAADGAPEPEAEDEPAVGATRRRAKKQAAAEPEAPSYTREELEGLTLVELKKKLKVADPKKWTTETLRGTKAPELVDELLALSDAGEGAPDAPDEADEAQGAPAARRGRSAAPATASEAVADVEGGDSEAESREAVFARLRGQRETAERMASQLVRVTAAMVDAASEEGGDDAAFETAAAAVAGALMLFADFIVTEVRKPKSAGRPRKDGTEAQPKAPKAAEPAEDAPAPRRGRGRKAAS
jgi:hypothetical protein